MRRTKIEEQNEYLLIQQRRFRVAADVVTDAWMAFPEIHAVAVIGSVAKALWKEIPRFSDFRREGIEVWHECRDLDLALWIESQQRLREIHRAANRALSKAFASGADTSVVPHQLDIFMFDPANDAYLGRLCSFNQCPKGKARLPRSRLRRNRVQQGGRRVRAARRSFGAGSACDALSARRRTIAVRA